MTRFLAPLLLLGCPDGRPDAPTWHADVAPLVHTRCVGCHAGDEGIGFPLTDPDVVAGLGEILLEVTSAEGQASPPYYMPPFGARDTEQCSPPAPWRDDRRLSDTERQTLADWLDAGAPLGDPTTAAPLPDVRAPSLAQEAGSTSTTLALGEWTLTEGETEDQYRCFPFQTDAPTEEWLTGIEVLPGNDRVVHHVVVFSDPGLDGPGRAESEGDGSSYPCFGGSGVAGGVLYAWTPGGAPFEVPDDAGMRLGAGGGLIAQVHYHPIGTQQIDQTEVKVRTTLATPDRVAEMRVVGAVFENSTNAPNLVDAPFSIPPDVPDHQEVWIEPVPADVKVFGVFPHMHLAGRSIRVAVDRAEGGQDCFLHTPRWDFDWQLTYVYDAPFADLPEVHAGDALRVECEYDNTFDNPFVVDLVDDLGIDGPTTLGVGEDTVDEMCVAIVGVVY